jgi:hypothetical protein
MFEVARRCTSAEHFATTSANFSIGRCLPAIVGILERAYQGRGRFRRDIKEVIMAEKKKWHRIAKSAQPQCGCVSWRPTPHLTSTPSSTPSLLDQRWESHLSRQAARRISALIRVVEAAAPPATPSRSMARRKTATAANAIEMKCSGEFSDNTFSRKTRSQQA